MLEQLSEAVRECLSLAAEAKARADETADPKQRSEFLKQETRWLKLSRSLEFTGSLDDFTAANAEQRRRIDQALRNKTPQEGPGAELRSLLASIVESSDDAIISKNLDGVITSWNNGAERIFGYAAEEVVGKPVLILIPTDRRDEEPFILERIRGGEKVDHYETVRRRKDGSLIDVSLCVSPVRDDRGTIIGASKIARDITQRKQTEKQLAILAREAEHRTRNILSTVSAAVELSQSDTPEGLKTAIRGRVQALANVHALFVESRWTGAELNRLVAQELSPYCQDDAERAVVAGPKVVLEPNVAQALAATLHELATNAAKYGALSSPSGHLRITWSPLPDNTLALRWTEIGGPPVVPPTRQGFGSRVMNALMKQIGGAVTFDWQRDGLSCDVLVPREET